MRKSITEIQNVLKTNGYSINNIICDVMKTFKFKSLCRQVGFQKQEGYSAFEIITLMLMFPLMLLKSVHALYRSEFQKVTDMKKDAIYRLKKQRKNAVAQTTFACGQDIWATGQSPKRSDSKLGFYPGRHDGTKNRKKNRAGLVCP
jgi:hypothetical protein